MNLNLEGKVALVSGGSKGIGFATASLLAKEGAKVVISARTEATLKLAAERLEALAPGRIFALAADMTVADEVSRVVATANELVGNIDIAISNVIGHQVEASSKGPPPGHFEDVPVAELRAEYRQLVLSALFLAREVLPSMRSRRWGRIINVASGVARESLWELPHFLPNVVRPAAAALHKVLAAKLANSGVTVNTILTGAIATERNQAYFNWLSQERNIPLDQIYAEFFANTPAKRPGKPEEMAAMMGFLCSPAGNYISGQGISVTGGMLRHIY